jgi:hypothetical protein
MSQKKKITTIGEAVGERLSFREARDHSPFLPPKQVRMIDTMVRREQDELPEGIIYHTRLLAQVSLPYVDPDLPAGQAWVRKNGNISILVEEGHDDDGHPLGFPSGPIPRLCYLQFVTTALITQSPRIELGHYFSSFMKKIGLSVTGGKSGTITSFKRQLDRMMLATIWYRDNTTNREGKLIRQRSRGFKTGLIKNYDLWWDPQDPDQGTLEPSWVLLDDLVFEDIMEHAFPLDLHAIAAFKQSALRLDLYTWLAWRAPHLQKTQRISWAALESQLGTQRSETRYFARAAKKAIKDIKALWPDLKVAEVHGGLEISPSRPHVPPRQQTFLFD